MNFLSSYYGSMVVLIPPFLLSLFAQFLVKSTFAKYSKIKTRRGLNGTEVAELLMRANSIHDVQIEPIRGSLSDHYSPSEKKLRLSEPVYNKTSISAIGVAAHETGHAIQDKVRYSPLILRSTLVPVANIGSSMGPYIAMAGIFLSMPMLLNLGIILFSGAVLFYLVTLPVEFNASSRALKNLEQQAILTDEELAGARKVLTAAALTYVASALTAMASLLRLILISRRDD